MLKYILLILFLNRLINTSSIGDSRPKKNSHVIFKKLSPIELNENIPIGYLIIDLKANLNDDFHYTFEFIEDLSDKRHSPHHSLVSIKNYFLLDVYTGIVHTSKSIDLENFCDLNLCQNKLVNSGSSQQTSEISFNRILRENCLIQFKIKATRQFYANKTNHKDQIYHISFDLYIRDINEYKPEFYQKETLYFNISEEFSPIKLPIGSVAFDNDCSDRAQLYYSVRILKVNSKPFGEYLKEVKQLLTSSNRRSSQEDLLGQNRSNIFDLNVIIDQDLLFLHSNRPFDRELHQSIELEIVASDRLDLNTAKSSSFKIVLNIADINDNAPRFQSQVYDLEFDEGLSPNTELIKLKAIDPDQGLNGEVRYEFAIQTDEIKETFFIHPITGSLVLKKKLDYGRKKQWQLSIRASDQSLNSNVKSSIALVNLRVNDINNHKPEISLNFFVLPGLIEPRLLTRKEINKDILVKEEVVYMTKTIPLDSTIGIVHIRDKDAELNGFIEGCEIYLTDEYTELKTPLYLEDYFELMDSLRQNSSLLHFSSDASLNNEIESLVSAEFKTNKHSRKATNEKKYFIRTNLNFRDLFLNSSRSSVIFSLELKSSDKGLNQKLVGIKNFKLFILNTNQSSIKGYNQVLDEDEIDPDVELIENQAELDETEDYDDDTNQYLGSGSTYKIEITEKNIVPIELAKINASDFDLNMPVKYKLILPGGCNRPQKAKYLQKKIKLIKCSCDLYKYISLDSFNGIIVLNKSIEREKGCLDFKYYISATDLVEQRLSSVLTFKIHINAHEDLGPKFEQSHFVFQIMENTVLESGFKIKLKESSLKRVKNLDFKIEELDQGQEDLQEYFTLQTNDHFLNLIIKKPFNYEIKNKYLFNLILLDKINSSKLDTSLIEINVLDSNEFRPEVRDIVIQNDENSVDLIVLNKTKVSNENYFILVNLDNLLKQQTSKSLIKIEAFDPDANGLVDGMILFETERISFFNSTRNFRQEEIQLNPPESIFSVSKSDGLLDVDLSDLNEEVIKTLFMCRLQIRIIDSSDSSPLSSNLNLIICFVRENTNQSVLLDLENSIYDKYSINRQNYLSTSKTSQIVVYKTNLTETLLKENLKSFRHILFTNQFPILILTVLILILLITLAVLFIVSILYSISICRLFKCKLVSDKEKKSDIKNADTRSNSDSSQLKSLLKENSLKAHEHGQLKFKISNLFCTEQKNELICSNICADHEEAKSTKFINEQNQQGDYLLDSPIVVRKLYETNDVETQQKYLKKYNLEYLFDDRVSTSSPKSLVDEKVKEMPNQQRKKKIKFNCQNTMLESPNGDKENQNLNSQSFVDDDFILPVKNNSTPYNYNHKNPSYEEYNNIQTISNTLYNQYNLNTSNTNSYKKCPIQPEDNIWIKKYQQEKNFLNEQDIVL